MKTFKHYVLTESTAEKQMETHLSHIEDLAIERGITGFNEFVNTVHLFLKKIQGLDSNIEVNLKVDGAPALLFGNDPRNDFINQFFISLKHSFDPATHTLKESGKIMHSEKEIQQFYGDRPQFAKKLINLFKELERAYDNSGLIYQCDVLYAQEEEKIVKNIDGEDFITFKPNVIVYAVPFDDNSSLFQQINNSSVGVSVHDSFKAQQTKAGIKLMQSSRKVNTLIESGKRAGVFIMGSNFSQMNTTVDKSSVNAIKSIINNCRENVKSISPVFDQAYVNSQAMEYLKIYINRQIDLPSSGIFGKNRLTKKDFDAFAKGFKRFLNERFHIIIQTKKTDRGRQNQKNKLDSLLRFLDSNQQSLMGLLMLFGCMIEAKKILLHMVEGLSHALKKTFIEADNGILMPSKGEGHVLFNGPTHVKIVDRLEFTKINRKKSRFGQ
jgi:hypothetical protein